MADLLILGHRGAASLPENTVPSFEEALKLGADGVELGVRQTADGKLAVVHGSVVGTRAVQGSTYEQIRKLKKGFEVPLLEDVLKIFGRKTFLDIEFKTPGFEEQAVELIREYADADKVLISGFDPEALSKVKSLFPEIQLGYIYNRTQDEESRHNCPIDVVIPQFRLASRELIEEVHDEGLRVIPWTVNEDREITRLLGLGVDGFITDHPEKVVALTRDK